MALAMHERLARNSEEIPIKPNQKYEIGGEAVFKSGEKYCAYVAAIILGKSGRETKRFIRWISDFSGTKQPFFIRFTTPPEAERLVIGYRINAEAPIYSSTEFELSEPSRDMLSIAKSDAIDDFDSPEEFEVPALPPLTKEQENAMERRITWIFGSPRSGTTWLMELLQQSDSKAWSEPFIGSMLGVDWRNRLYDNFYHGKPQFFLSSQHIRNWAPLLRSLVLMRGYSHVQSLSKRLVIKEALGSAGADVISKVLPESRIICIVRDGRDAVDSNIDAHRPGGWGHDAKPIAIIKTPEERRTWIREYSEQWKKINDVILKAYNQHNSSLRLMIKYEDLLTNTLEHAKKIYEFMGVKLPESAIIQKVEKLKFDNIPKEKKGDGKFYRSASPGLWKEHFNKEEQALMNAMMGDTLKAFGYTI